MLIQFSEQTKINLDDLLSDDIRATNISDTIVPPTVPPVDICSDTTIRSSTTECSSTDNVSATDIVVSDTDNVSDTNSRGKYQNEWKRKNRDIIRFDVKKGTKSFLQNEASKRGISLTQMIKDALKLYLSTN